ncbi:hypothetical protein CFP56_016667 [Quercus suber]|uniref:KIB1-4 beta-propeller domain-containing protein n=1 Tax=Quercus suber TaxID=58331 RepID=A0AAW0KPF3_QUESU
MIPPANDASETHCKFFSILENKLYKLELPKVQGKLLRGSSYGWLVLSSNPTTSKEYMVMAIYGVVSDLAFCKNGDKKWTLIQQNDQHINHDIISHKGKFYVLRNDGGLWVGDRTSLPNMTQLVPSLPRTILNYFSLVRTMSGEFFMVRKIHELEPISRIDHIYSYKTIDFVVYKLDHHQGELK